MSRLESRLDAGEMQETEQVEIKRNNKGQFEKGQSGNPTGKKKATQEELDAMQAIRDLAPQVAPKMKELLDAARIPAVAKVRILEIILERTFGKVESAVKVTNTQESVEAAQAELEAIFASCEGTEDEADAEEVVQ